MLGKNYKFRGYSLADIDLYQKRSAMQQVTKNASIRGNTYAFANSHGSTIGPRISESRLFTFTGRVHQTDKRQREKVWSELSTVFHIEGDLSDHQTYPLEWMTKYDEPRVADCYVYSPLVGENGIDNPVIDFTFELVSPDPRIYDPRIVQVNGGLGQMGAGPLWNILPFEIDDMFDGGIECIHEGDRPAPCMVRVQGYCVNPKIFVIQDNEIKYFLKIDGDTTDLIVDNRNTTSLDANERFVLTDNGLNIKSKRRQEGGGGPLFIPQSLEPFGGTKVSYVLVTADNYISTTANVSVFYRNTYSY